jgi:hypothetical protein
MMGLNGQNITMPKYPNLRYRSPPVLLLKTKLLDVMAKSLPSATAPGLDMEIPQLLVTCHHH